MARKPSHLISKEKSPESKGFSAAIASMGSTNPGSVSAVADGEPVSMRRGTIAPYEDLRLRVGAAAAAALSATAAAAEPFFAAVDAATCFGGLALLLATSRLFCRA